MKIEKIKEKLKQNIIYYEEVTSTSDLAKELIKQGVEEGTLILADRQTKGRGTNGRAWCTGNHENIAMTLIFFPKCTVERLEGLTRQIAEKILEAVYELYGKRLEIKEPNDILLYGKKLGGILTESLLFKGEVKYLMIGIGFNVNQLDFPEEIQKIATSLKKEFGAEFSREEIVIGITEKLNALLGGL